MGFLRAITYLHVFLPAAPGIRKYLRFDRFAGQTSVPHNASLDKEDFGDFWVVSNSCGNALKLLISVRMRQRASL